MTVNQKYEVIKRIKIHTSPLVEANVIQCGKFVKETDKNYIFDSFRVKKDLVTHISEVGL